MLLHHLSKLWNTTILHAPGESSWQGCCRVLVMCSMNAYIWIQQRERYHSDGVYSFNAITAAGPGYRTVVEDMTSFPSLHALVCCA